MSNNIVTKQHSIIVYFPRTSSHDELTLSKMILEQQKIIAVRKCNQFSQFNIIPLKITILMMYFNFCLIIYIYIYIYIYISCVTKAINSDVNCLNSMCFCEYK